MALAPTVSAFEAPGTAYFFRNKSSGSSLGAGLVDGTFVVEDFGAVNRLPTPWSRFSPVAGLVEGGLVAEGG